MAQSKGPARKRGGKGREPSAPRQGSGTLLPEGKQPPAGGEAGPNLEAGEGAHHLGAAAAGRAERRRGAGPVPEKEHREVELGHRVPLPTRGTSFRLRICCRSPADPPLPPLPSCSIRPPFTAERGRRVPDVLLWLTLSARSPLCTSAASASPSAWALFLPAQRPYQVMVPFSNQSAPQMAEAGRELFPPLTLRTAYPPDTTPTGCAPYWGSLSCSRRAHVSAAPPRRK